MPLDILYLPIDDFLLGGPILGLSDGLDEHPSLLADELRSLVVLEEILHFNLPVRHYYKQITSTPKYDK